MTVLRRDSRNPVGVPDVCVNLVLDEFELIEVVDDLAGVFDHDVVGFLESVWIAKPEGRRAVAGDEFRGVVSHAPSFTGVAELRDGLECETVVDETEVRLPCPLEKVRSPVDDPLAEIFRRKIVTRSGLTGFRVESHYARTSSSACALIKHPIQVEKAFGVALRGVRERCHYSVAVNGGRARWQARQEKDQKR